MVLRNKPKKGNIPQLDPSQIPPVLGDYIDGVPISLFEEGPIGSTFSMPTILHVQTTMEWEPYTADLLAEDWKIE